ncbi:hypothetical protein HID58_053240, partial [Brassica napus]
MQRGRVRVFINGDLPLKFEYKVGFQNGDVVKVTIIYEDLHRHCFTCKRITHEEGTCPELTEVQREKNPFSNPFRRNPEAYHKPPNHRESRDIDLRNEKAYVTNQRREDRHENRQEYGRSHDLRNRITDRREAQSKNVWNRLDNSNQSELPRNRERYHPYQDSSRMETRGKNRDTTSSSEWRPKDRKDRRTDSYSSYVKQTGKGNDHTERHDNHSPRRRHSPDSQRTISENLQSKWPRGHYGGRRSRSPPTQTMEWRPVRKYTRTKETNTTLRQENAGSRSIELTGTAGPEAAKSGRTSVDIRIQSAQENRRQQVIGEEGEQEKITPRVTENLAPSLERETDTNMYNKEVVTEVELHKEPMLGIDKDHVDTTKDNEKGEEDIDTTIAKYAELAMNEEMMENDDLLDEISEEEIQAFEKELEDERIEAISQLSPSRKDRPSLTKPKEPSEVQDVEAVARGTSKKPVLGKTDTTIAQTIGKRRGTRSPDLKGAAASKKLASLGGDQMRHGIEAGRWKCQVDASWIEDQGATGL